MYPKLTHNKFDSLTRLLARLLVGFGFSSFVPVGVKFAEKNTDEIDTSYPLQNSIHQLIFEHDLVEYHHYERFLPVHQN